MDGFWAKSLGDMEQGPRAKQVGKHGVHGHEDMKGMALEQSKDQVACIACIVCITKKKSLCQSLVGKGASLRAHKSKL